MSDGAPLPVRYFKWTLFIGTSALIVYLCLLVLRPFLHVLVWSSVLAIAFYPLYQSLLRYMRRPWLSALVCSFLVVVAILVPLSFVARVAVEQFLSLRDYLQQQYAATPETAAGSFRWATGWLERLGLDITITEQWLASNASEIGRIVAENSLSIAANLTSIAMSFVFTIFAMFLMFRDGDRIVAKITDLLPFDRTTSAMLLGHVGEVVHGSVYGVVVIALVQGLLCGTMFWFLGVPSAALWGAMTVLTSVLPLVGAAAVWIPGTIYLLISEEWGRAAILAVWGTLVVSGVDNFVRPKLVGGRVGLNELVMFFALLGGLQVFGLLGIVLGPALFAVAASIIEVLSQNRARNVAGA